MQYEISGMKPPLGGRALRFPLWPSKFVWADLIGAKSYQNLVVFFQPN